MGKKVFEIKNKEEMKKAVGCFRQIIDWLKEYKETDNGKINAIESKTKFDGRDFCFLAAFMHGCNTKEEFFESLNKSTEEFENDYKKAVNDFLDKYENIDFRDIKTDDYSSCLEALLIGKLAQIPGNINGKIPGFREERYNSIEMQQKYDGYTPFLSFLAFEMCDEVIKETGFNWNRDDGVPDEGYEDTLTDQEGKSITCDPNSSMDYDKGITEYYNIKAPTFFYYHDILNSPDKNTLSEKELEKYGSISGEPNCIFNLLEGRFMNNDLFTTRNIYGVSDATLKSIFIDGKPLNECLEKQENEDLPTYRTRLESYIVKSFKEGKPVELCQTFIQDGKADSRIIPFKITWSDEIVKMKQEEKVVREHSWFRRTFFDWGPFKIKRDPNVMDEVFPPKDAENEANKEERHSKIMDYRNGKFLDELNARREKDNKPSLQPGVEMDSPKKQATKEIDTNKFRRKIDIKEVDKDLNKSNIKEKNKEKTLEKDVNKEKEL